ncbi:MAG TPA: polyamine ABC transporter substrate-binding protein [Caulobacteraceae bacterium]|jgi:putrescine transport system substrate-binding protein|nr:polyamine ABC transporter substrate-binding protein [Caulobacteraceae bacterium]
MGVWRAAWVAGVAALATAGCGPTGDAARTVRIYNWSDYIDPAILKDFTKATGIAASYDVFDSNEVQETKVLTGGTGYDVVTPSNNNVARFIAAHAIQPLDLAQLPNRKNLWPELTARMEPFDPGGRYSVPYMWGTIGLGYDSKALAQRLPGVKVDSWRIAFDPAVLAELQDCGVYFLDASEDMYSLVLAWLGKDPNSRDPADYAAATAVLEKVRPYVRKFHSSEYINALATGQACLAIGYSGDVLQARDRAAEAGKGVEIAYAIPKEGAQVWFDVFAIPADAPHPQAAYAFLNYMLRPEVIARASNAVRYANANAAATPLVDPAVRNDPNIYPTPEVFARLFVLKGKDQALLREVNRQWTRVQTGR